MEYPISAGDALGRKTHVWRLYAQNQGDYYLLAALPETEGALQAMERYRTAMCRKYPAAWIITSSGHKDDDLTIVGGPREFDDTYKARWYG